jgi:hypothetical protein
MSIRLLGAAGLSLALALPAWADPPAKDQYKPVTTLTGRIANFDAGDGTLSLKVVETQLRPQGRGVRAEQKERTEDLTLAGEVKVRTAKPPERTDDNGKAKPYTPRELEKLRARDVPGKWYVADLKAVQKGQTVTVMLGVPKDAVAPKSKEKDSLAAAAAGKDKPAVYEIVIVADAPPEPKEKKK